MNENVFNDLKMPLYTLCQIVVAESIFGNAFQVASGALTSAGTVQQMVMVLTNPSGSGIRAVIDSVEVSANATGSVLMTVRFDGTATGVLPVTGYNLNAGTSGTPVCTSAAGGGAGVSISGGNIIQSNFVNIADDNYPVAAVLTPGHSVGLNFVFGSAGTKRGTFTFRWYEIPLEGGFAS